MQLRKNKNRRAKENSACLDGRTRRWGQTTLSIAAMAALSVAAYSGQQQVQRDPAWRTTSQSANGIPDPNELSQMRDRQAAEKSFETANAERMKEISDDSEKLLKLAADLKDEVDKTNKDTLSISVIKKAEEIEKLARNVREKMKLTVGAS